MSDSDWLREPVHLDPALKDPFDLFGSSASRRVQVGGMLRRLGLDDYGLTDCTYELLWPMVERVAETLATRRVLIGARARAIADASLGDERKPPHDRLPSHLVWAALLDFKWSDRLLTLGNRPTVRDACDAARELYVEHMTTRVTAMLRDFERKEWLSDAH